MPFCLEPGCDRAWNFGLMKTHPKFMIMTKMKKTELSWSIYGYIPNYINIFPLIKTVKRCTDDWRHYKNQCFAFTINQKIYTFTKTHKINLLTKHNLSYTKRMSNKYKMSWIIEQNLDVLVTNYKLKHSPPPFNRLLMNSNSSQVQAVTV